MDTLLDWAAHGLGMRAAIVWTLVSTHFTVIAASLYLHRDLTHRTIDLHPVVAHVCRFWLWLTTGMVTGAWVAVHRKHHACCDQDDDPHSPVVHGLRAVLLRGSELYRAHARDPETLARWGGGTPDDWLERHVYARHCDLGLGLLLALDLGAFGAIGLVVWAVQMAWMPVLAAGVLNGIGHLLGYRNFDVGDTSHNFFPIGLLIAGEELHNNHHARPGSARFSVRWFEFDVGWAYIRVLRALGLARLRTTRPG